MRNPWSHFEKALARFEGLNRLADQMLSMFLPKIRATAACFSSMEHRSIRIGGIGNFCVFRVEKRSRECCQSFPGASMTCVPTSDWSFDRYRTGSC